MFNPKVLFRKKTKECLLSNSPPRCTADTLQRTSNGRATHQHAPYRTAQQRRGRDVTEAIRGVTRGATLAGA